MALIEFSDFKVVEIIQQITVKSGEALADRKGKYLRVDGTTGLAMFGNATTTGEVGVFKGLALTTQQFVGDSVTILMKGIVDVGDGVDGLAVGASVFVSDTDGELADTAGTVSTIAGRVYPVFSSGDGTFRKLLYINLAP